MHQQIWSGEHSWYSTIVHDHWQICHCVAHERQRTNTIDSEQAGAEDLHAQLAGLDVQCKLGVLCGHKQWAAAG